MKVRTIACAIAAMLVSSAAYADDCKMDGKVPEMPDPATATADDRAAAIKEIKEFQAALGEYRQCLNAMIDDEALDKEVRQAAYNVYNDTVDAESGVVQNWVVFNEEYQEANS